MAALVGLGRVYARTGRSAEATVSFRRAIAVADRPGANDPDLADALVGLAALTTELAEARALFERATAVVEAVHGEHTGRQAEAAVRAGETAGALGDHAGAIGWYERVLALPADANAEARAAAVLGLARELAGEPEATARVCDLLAEARLSLPAQGSLREEALRSSRCVASGR